MARPGANVDRRQSLGRRNQRRRRFRPAVELLEPRMLLSVFTVTNTSDAGSGSLREAILQANATPGADKIQFSVGVGPQTITPLTQLPALTDPVVIDATTQPGFTATPVIELRGNNLAAPALQLSGGDSTVRGLVINRFYSNAVVLASSRNVVEGCWIGLDATGTQAATNQYFGILVTGADNRIGGLTDDAGNVISGNYLGGIRIEGGTATGNSVQGNRVGTDITGLLPVPNVGGFNSGAIEIAGATGNVIGGREPDAGNLISGNGSWAIRINGAAATGNLVEGNVLGLDATGGAALHNGGGVRIDGAASNTIGGDSPTARNVISASGNGVYIVGATARDNLVQGNIIGLDVTGTRADVDDVPGNGNELGNSYGVYISDGPENRILANVVSGNTAYGFGIFGACAYGNIVQGNLIGTDVTGSVGLGNSSGMTVQAPQTLIGGTLPGEGNVIADSNGPGITIYGGNASGNTLQGNLIGTAIDGRTALGNRDAGLFISLAGNTQVGGTVPEAANVISANGSYGISIGGSTATGNRLQGNLIGTDRDGLVALGNGAAGIILWSGATNNLIGGADAGTENVISGNQGQGVLLSAPSPGNKVQNNRIGTDRSGTLALGNASHGIWIATSDSLIGGPEPSAGNTIAYNGGTGVLITQGTRNQILSNAIYENSNLGIDLAPTGVTLNDPGDVDTGPNDRQNFPVLGTAERSWRGTVVTGSLNSQPHKQYTIQLFASLSPDPSNHGEGMVYVGSTHVTTDANGDVAWDFTVKTPVPAGASITATTTDPDGNTSEFSAAVVLTQRSDLEEFLTLPETFAGPHDRIYPGTSEATTADTPELRDLQFLAHNVPASDFPYWGHVDTPLLILYSRYLQGSTIPAAENLIFDSFFDEIFANDGPRPLVQAYVASASIARSALSALGMEVTAATDTAAWQVVAGYLPIAAIADVARMEGLGSLTTAVWGTPDAQGNVTNQGETATFADQLKLVLPTVDGNEANIDRRIEMGVISDSFSRVGGGVGASQATGDLPLGPTVTVLQDGRANDSDEGRAMAELIYDIGPQYNFLFHTRGSCGADMVEAYRDLRDAGADIIADDISCFDEPVFQDGQVAETVDDVYLDNGIVSFVSAGNRNGESYFGTWTDTDENGYHEFAAGDETLTFVLGNAQSLTVYLHWSQPWGQATTDIDLELFNANLTVKVADSNYDNNPILLADFGFDIWTGPSREVLTFTNNTGGSHIPPGTELPRWRCAGRIVAADVYPWQQRCRRRGLHAEPARRGRQPCLAVRVRHRSGTIQ